MKRFINRIPVPMAGLMLAFASTGNLVSSYGVIYKNIFGGISALLLLLLLAKIILNFESVKEDLKNPVIAGVAPTLFMGIMILSTYMKTSFPSAAFMMWILGIALHFCFMIYFTLKFFISFDIRKVFTSYFVTYVGIVAASLTSPAYKAGAFGELIFWFGLLVYLILLPIVIYRVAVVKSIPEPALPTLAIFAAPASLCLAGYMNAFDEKNIFFVLLMLLLSLVMYLAVILCMPRLLKLKFYPSYAAFTFPFVISAIASKSANAFLIKSGVVIPVLNYIVKLQEFIAIGLVIYVLIRYIYFLFEIKPAVGRAKVEKTV